MKNSTRGLVATEGITVGDVFALRVASKFDDSRLYQNQPRGNGRGKERKTGKARGRGESRILEKLAELDNTDASACSTVIPRENNFICSIKSTFPLRLYPFPTRFSDHLVELLAFSRLGSSRHLHVMHKNTVLQPYVHSFKTRASRNRPYFINGVTFFFFIKINLFSMHPRYAVQE